MQATATFRRPRIGWRPIVVLGALLAAYLVGGASGYLAKSLSLQPAPAQTRSVVVSTGAADYGSAWNYSSRRFGTQSIEGPTLAATPSPIPHEPGSRRGGSQI